MFRQTNKVIFLSLFLLVLTFYARPSAAKRQRPATGATQHSWADNFSPRSSAQVLHVVDGDTAYFLLDDGAWVKGRLAGINAPECHKQQVIIGNGRGRSAACHQDDEYYGLKAARELGRLVGVGGAHPQPVSLDCERLANGMCRLDNHRRVLVIIFSAGKDVASELVRLGAAFTFTAYPSSARAQLCEMEMQARQNRRGLWSSGATVEEVLSKMSNKTRRWYQRHDQICQKALGKSGSFNWLKKVK